MQTDAELNVEPIAQAIDDLAEDLEKRALQLRRHATDLRSTGDLDEASAAISVAVSTTNMRPDLIVTRVVRQLQRSVKPTGAAIDG